MVRAALFFVLFVLVPLPALAHESRPAGSPASSTPAGAEPSYYYPPPGSLSPPLSAREVCRSLRSGLTGPEVAQDLRERGFLGVISQDEANDARAAGASSELIAALQAGRFTVSPGYVQRQREDSSAPARSSASTPPASVSRRSSRSRAAAGQAVSTETIGSSPQQTDAERVLANARLRQQTEEAERQRLSNLAAGNERAAAARAEDDARRLENMKNRADWEARQRDAHNASGGYWLNGHWYRYR